MKMSLNCRYGKPGRVIMQPLENTRIAENGRVFLWERGGFAVTELPVGLKLL